MATTTFTNGVTLTDEDWFNDVDFLVYDLFGDSTTTASAASRLAPSFNNLTVAGTLSVSALAAVQGLQVAGALSVSALAAVQALRVSGVLSVTAGAVFQTLAATDISASAVAGLVVATQAQMEAGSSVTTVVTPGRQQFHPGAAKGWVRASTNGTADASYNVTSLTDDGAGLFTITWATDFSATADYCVVGTSQIVVTGTATMLLVSSRSILAGSVAIQIHRVSDSSATDPDKTHVVAFGDQA